jgi:hypothetical protein
VGVDEAPKDYSFGVISFQDIYDLTTSVLIRIDTIISIQLKALQCTHKIFLSVGSVLNLTSYDLKQPCGATYERHESAEGGFKPHIKGVCENDLNGRKRSQILIFDSLALDRFEGLKDTPIVEIIMIEI